MDPAVAKLQALVRIPTVSRRDRSLVDTAAFDRLLTELARQFPLVHERLDLTRVGSHGLLFHWRGASDARPVVLMAHLDVVPVDGQEWTLPPFGGDLLDDAVWGRGTLDDKGCVVGICEAVERLLADGFTPAQDVWLSFGCDEEVSGAAALAAVAELRRRGVRPWFVLDEGGAVALEAFPGVTAPVGVVGVSEKGTTSIELVATGDGGHASTPAKDGPTARLARAILRLDAAGMPGRVPATTVEMFRRLAPHAPAPLRPVLANAGRLGPALTRVLPRLGHEAAALVRTTFAVTTLEGSPALNVIATTAKAGVNIRVMIGDTVESSIDFVRRTIRDDTIEIRLIEGNDPSPVSPLDDAYALIEARIAEVFPEAVATPYVMLAATDSRFFTKICERVYRFAPFRMTAEQRAAIHAADEHLRVADLVDGIRWYRRLIEELPA
jgi:carboxypeptidase PM20D1